MRSGSAVLVDIGCVATQLFDSLVVYLATGKFLTGFYDMSKLSAALAEAKKASDKAGANSNTPDFRVVIRGDREGSARSVATAMNAAAEAGIWDISFSTSNKE